MLKLSRKSDYALVALAELARHADAAEPISARQLADQYRLPAALLTNLLKQLHKAELVDSIRGAHGGYRLARDPRRISLSQVIEAVDGPIALAMCACDHCDSHDAEDENATCHLFHMDDGCPVSDGVRQLNDFFQGMLGHIHLHDLVNNTMEQAIARSYGAQQNITTDNNKDILPAAAM